MTPISRAAYIVYTAARVLNKPKSLTVLLSIQWFVLYLPQTPEDRPEGKWREGAGPARRETQGAWPGPSPAPGLARRAAGQNGGRAAPEGAPLKEPQRPGLGGEGGDRSVKGRRRRRGALRSGAIIGERSEAALPARARRWALRRRCHVNAGNQSGGLRGRRGREPGGDEGMRGWGTGGTRGPDPRSPLRETTGSPQETALKPRTALLRHEGTPQGGFW